MKGSKMNYYEWSQDYKHDAEMLEKVIKKLKQRCRRASKSERKQLEARLSEYTLCYNDCMRISKHLMDRHKGVA